MVWEYPLAALSIQGRRDGKTDLRMAVLRNFGWKKRSRFWDDGALGEVSAFFGPSGHWAIDRNGFLGRPFVVVSLA